MNKVKELLIKVLDEGEVTSIRDMKIPSLKIGKLLVITTAILSPLLGCILGITFMDVNSKEFTVLTIPLLLNVEIFLCWLLCHFWGMLKISRKKMMVYTICMVIIVAVASLAVNRVYKKSEVNLELELWNRYSTFSDQELLKEYLAFLDDDSIRVCKNLVMPKQTLKRLIDGTSTATRYCSTSVRHVLVLSHCYGKEFTLSNRKICDKFLFDSLSKHLNPLWEKEKK